MRVYLALLLRQLLKHLLARILFMPLQNLIHKIRQVECHLRFHRHLGFDNSDAEVAISVNKNGQVKAFVREGAKVDDVTLPIHAGDILAIDSITVFRTSNPTICWISGGRKSCIDIPD